MSYDGVTEGLVAMFQLLYSKSSSGADIDYLCVDICSTLGHSYWCISILIIIPTWWCCSLIHVGLQVFFFASCLQVAYQRSTEYVIKFYTMPWKIQLIQNTGKQLKMLVENPPKWLFRSNFFSPISAWFFAYGLQLTYLTMPCFFHQDTFRFRENQSQKIGGCAIMKIKRNI